MADIDDIEELDPVERAVRRHDVYVFYKETKELAQRFNPVGNPEFRFVADMDGWPWTAFAIVTIPNLYALPPVADRIQGSPEDPVDDTAKPVKYGTRSLRYTKHYRYFGFARLIVDWGRAEYVLQAIDDSTDGYSGSALVSGAFQLLVEVGADQSEDVAGRLEALRRIDGVTDAQTGLVTGEYYYYFPRKRKLGEREEETA
jgi:hypothetical protein